MAYGNNELVGYGAPATAGAVFIAPKGTPLPTSVDDALNSAFKNLGFVSEDGITISEDSDTSEIKAWGGATVQTVISKFQESISFTPIEINETVAKATYGENNVEVQKKDNTVTMTTKHSGADIPEVVLVIETLPNSNAQARYIAPKAKLTERGDLELTATDAQGRELTFTLFPDEANKTLIVYEKITTSTQSA